MDDLPRLFKLVAAAFAVVVVFPGNLLAQDASFRIQASLLQDVSLKNGRALNFGKHEVVTSDTSFVVSPQDAGAAKFQAKGKVGAYVTGSVSEQSVTLSCSTPSTCRGNTMVVDRFTLGGDMSKTGGARFNREGYLSSLLIGARLTVTASDKEGDYGGQATFRLVYK